jgi:hypothetical protein
MRLPIHTLIIAATLAGASQTVTAQSPNSYPWCARTYSRDTITSCYYATKELCLLSVAGIGGYCAPNPGYRGLPAGAARRNPKSSGKQSDR